MTIDKYFANLLINSETREERSIVWHFSDQTKITLTSLEISLFFPYFLSNLFPFDALILGGHISHGQ